MRKPMIPVVALAIIGAGGLSLIKSSEGLRTTAYADPIGLPTVCYGHTGPEVRVGQRMTTQQCEALLIRDVAAHQVVLIPGSPQNCISSVALNQNQLDALTSLTFNTGTTRFCSSTMASYLRVKGYEKAANEFTKWDKARVNGKLVVLPGLAKRRTAEKTLFLTPSPIGVPNALTGALRATTGISG